MGIILHVTSELICFRKVIIVSRMEEGRCENVTWYGKEAPVSSENEGSFFVE
jgi:hypothetical protein